MQEFVEKIVPVGFGIVTALDALLKDKMGRDTFMIGPGEGKAAVIGLYAAAGDDGICTSLQSFAEVKFQLACFTASSSSWKHIIPLDIELYAIAEIGAQPG